MGDVDLSFAVAVSTIGRTHEVAALLKSIGDSTIHPVQIIVVDQNPDDRLAAVVAQFPALRIDHRRVTFKGLSAAKNYAATLACSDVLFTPDDDCKVLPDTFRRALDELDGTGADAVFGKCLDENGDDSIISYRKQAGWLSRNRLEGMFVEPATAVRTAVLRDFPFDETFGVGTFHGAEEGYDWVLRLLHAGKRLYFQPAVRFFHPRTIVDYGSPQALSRVFSYRCGYGRLCRKHGLWGKYAARAALVVAGVAVYSIVNRTKARYYVAELAGLLAGATIEP